MTDHDEDDLDAAVASLYSGPLDEFVSARDALAKQLRASDRRDQAKEVKALRKPSRTAWALNAAQAHDPALTERVAATVADVLHAQSSGGDLRGTLDQLREAVRVVAAAAARAAADAGHPSDQAAFSQAVSAVVADSDSFEALRAGRLTAVPTSSGLDLLTAPRPARTVGPEQDEAAAVATPATDDRSSRSATTGPEAGPDPDVEAAAQAAVRSAETTMNVARQRAEAAESTLRKAESSAAAADDQLRFAERRAETAHAKLDQARHEAETAQADERAAEEAVAEAQKQLNRLKR